ncbi:MAG: porin [Schleiferiaceae bacterium]|nr:porin [Schleiferiaceae bacterium]
MDVKVVFLALLIACTGTSLQAQLDEDEWGLTNSYDFGEGWIIKGNNVATEITGMFQPQFEWKHYGDKIEFQDVFRSRIRRFRLRFNGQYEPARLFYRVQYDFGGVPEIDNGELIRISQAYIGTRIGRRARIIIGQRASPANNRELFMNSGTLQLVERSRVTSAFASLAEFGVFFENTWRLSSTNYIRGYTSITTGDGAFPIKPDFGGFKYSARLDYLPFGLFTRYGQFRQVDMVRELTPKLIIGAFLSQNQGVSSRRGRTQGSILYLDSAFNTLLPNYSQMGIDFMFKYRGFSMIGEWVRGGASVPDGILYRVRTDGSISTDFLVNDLQNMPDYVKSRMMLGNGYNLQAGFLTKKGISFDGRYSHLVADPFSFLTNGTFYNRPSFYTLGMSKYMTRWYGMKIQGSVTMNTVAPGANSPGNDLLTKPEWTYRLITSFLF